MKKFLICLIMFGLNTIHTMASETTITVKTQTIVEDEAIYEKGTLYTATDKIQVELQDNNIISDNVESGNTSTTIAVSNKQAVEKYERERELLSKVRYQSYGHCFYISK
ncbi:MAG: hypothetical protein ACRC5M_02775 [Anaeroplasmataceae bacterium]